MTVIAVLVRSRCVAACAMAIAAAAMKAMKPLQIKRAIFSRAPGAGCKACCDYYKKHGASEYIHGGILQAIY
jgi:hypothetical protein